MVIRRQKNAAFYVAVLLCRLFTSFINKILTKKRLLKIWRFEKVAVPLPHNYKTPKSRKLKGVMNAILIKVAVLPLRLF